MALLSGITDALGLTDSGAAKEAYGEAAALTKEQRKALEAISLPELEEYILQSPELVGLLEAEQLGPSALEEISLDPALREKQMQALSQLQEQADEGLTATDKYAMEQLLGGVASQEQARQKQIEDQMAQRGMDSSGAALMSKMQSSQGAANDARARAMQMAAMGQQNRQNAIAQLGQQAGNIQQQDYSRQANTASARDAIAQANAAARQNVNAQNLAARQNIANQKANIANQQSQVGNQIAQQRFQNEMQKVTGQNQATQNMANMYTGQAQAQAQADANTMGTLGSLGAAFIGAEDGALIKKDLPEYGCGGVHKKKAMDGDMMYVSDGTGDIVDSGMESYADDRVDAKINDGEAVINVPQQQRFMDLIRGKIGLTELGDDDIVEGVPKDYRDDLHEKIEEESESSVREKGLEKLIKLLGKE